jgi:hypothetical protein
MSTLETPTVARPAPAAQRKPVAPTSASPEIRGREIALVVLGGIAIAIAMSWPLALHMGSRISPDIGDPIRTAWQVAFAGHQLLHDPLHLWTSNAFWPHPDSFLFSDSLLGYAPAAFFGSGPVAALVRYNVLWIGAYAFTFVGAYLLARELRAGRAGGLVAGAAFAYAPYRLDEAGHLHVVSAGGVALTLFLLLRGYRRRSRGLVLAGWLLAAWQMSLGFTLGLQLAYTIAAIAIVLGVLAWRRRADRDAFLARERECVRGLLVASAVGMAVFGAVTAIEAHAYLRVGDEYPTAKRTIAEVKRYSANLDAFIAAPAQNRVWGGATAGARHQLSSQNESSLFPGLTILALAAVGLGAGLYSRRLRVALVATGAVSAIISLGFNPTFGNLTYKPLFRFAPGFDAIRTPGRFAMLTSLSLALLAAAGTHELVRRLRARENGSSTPTLARYVPAALATVLAALVVVEGTGHLGHPRVPVLPAALQNVASLPRPLLMLPTDPATDRAFQYFSTQGFPRIANGNSTFDLPAQDDLRGGMQNFPDAAGVRKLRSLGIRTVVLVTDLRGNPAYPFPPDHVAIPEPPDPAAAARKPVAGLGITKRLEGDVVIYELSPARAVGTG